MVWKTAASGHAEAKATRMRDALSMTRAATLRMPVASDGNVSGGPVAADMADQASDVTGGLCARWRLASTQQHGNRPAGSRIVDVDRQKTACPVVTVPEGQLLVAVHHAARVVDVERHGRRFGRIAAAVNGDHGAHHARQFAGRRHPRNHR